MTDIEWTDSTWNPVRGCARVSPGCEHCYAERQAHRFNGPGQPYEGLTVLGKKGPRWAGRARFVPDKLGEPLRWRKPRRVFVNSMSDLFHEDVTNEQIAAVFGVMAACPQHTFQVLTKRPERMAEWFEWLDHFAAFHASHREGPDREDLHVRICVKRADEQGLNRSPHRRHIEYPPWPLPNVWLGVSVEDQPNADKRVPLLIRCPAAVRFVSAEPLLGPVDLKLAALDWVIVGGESGPGARPCDVSWIRSVVAQCREAKVPVFVKQLGAMPGVDPTKTPHSHPDFKALEFGLKNGKGGDPAEWPEDLRVREWPAP